MKNIIHTALIVLLSLMIFSCRSTKKIQSAINKIDTTSIIITNQAALDSIRILDSTLVGIKKSHVDFNTFTGKIKAEYVDNSGKQSNVTVYVKVIKDSMIWMSLYGSVFNIEAFRVLIKKDSVIVMDKLNKEVQYRSLNYLQDVSGIPFDFKTLQDLLVGNPIYFDTTVVAFKQTNDNIQLSTIGKYFKNMLTINKSGNIVKTKLDDVDVSRSRTATISYADYVPILDGSYFSTYREINVSEKTKLEVRLNFKQFEFNKALSITFNIPKNYKKR